MPIYGYACKSCDHSFDALQKMSDPRLVDCPACGEASLQKQLSAPKFRLKGAGWYETDFKTGDKRNLAGDADKSSDGKSKDVDKSSTSADSTSNSKPEQKTETKKPATESKAKSA